VAGRRGACRDAGIRRVTVGAEQQRGGETDIGYPVRCERWPAFDLIGFTKIVSSGGEQYDAVRGDGRWEVLRRMAGADQRIYGVASHDAECPEGRYRYTVAVREPAGPCARDDLFPIHIGESEWLVFTLTHFGRQYGAFWQDNPYALTRKLGREFNRAVGLHLDVFDASEDDSMEFWMPVLAGKEGPQ
jgi:predicted transcriptional regulator YdeE